MVARTLILIFVTALVLIGFVFMAPLEVVLKARGYTPEQISQVKALQNPTDVTTNAITKPDEPEAGPEPKASKSDDQTAALAVSNSQEAGNTAAREAQPETPAAPPQPRQFVATDTINVRAGQGTDTDVVGQLAPKTLVTVLDNPDGDWMKVQASDVSGWVYKPLFEPKR